MKHTNKFLILLGFTSLFIASCHSFEVTPTPPLLDVPTYSLATLNPDGTTTGMNILTYASPVSVQPDRVWAIGLYKGTQAHENFSARKEGVLQMLTESQSSLVQLLGGCSGRDVCKEEECKKLGHEWVSLDESLPHVLPKCSHYLSLILQGDLIDAGSHDIAICRVDSIMVENVETPRDNNLSTALLRKMGIITEQGRVSEPWPVEQPDN